MSVIQFWKERLQARNPLYSPAWKVREDFKPRRGEENDTWPHSVVRDVLYQDYCIWFEQKFLEAYRQVLFFQEHLPKPVDAYTFFCTMAPWLYLLGQDVQVRHYQVPRRQMYEGKWVTTKRYRYFVRMCEWSTHVAAFEMYAGVKVMAEVEFFEAVKAQKLAEELTNFSVKITESGGGG